MFVCTGNTCRSAMAHHMLEKMIKEKDNVTDEEIKLINSLNISDSDKEKLNEILNSKETINKELVGV
jgi:protein-tyrosine-phosphatase